MPIYEASLVQNSQKPDYVTSFSECLWPTPPYSEATSPHAGTLFQTVNLIQEQIWVQMQMWVEFEEAMKWSGLPVNLKLTFKIAHEVMYNHRIAVSALCLPRGDAPILWAPDLLAVSQDWSSYDVPIEGDYTIDYGSKAFIMNPNFNPVFCFTSDLCLSQTEPSTPGSGESRYYGSYIEKSLDYFKLEVTLSGDAVWHGDPF